MRKLFAVLICIAALHDIQASRAEDGQLEKRASEMFGRDKLKPLDNLNAEELQKQADAVAQDVRFIRTYLVLLRAFKSSSALQELRPRFNDSVSRVASAFVKTVDTVKQAGLSEEVSKFQNELPRLMADPNMAAEYLLFEADAVAPFGISPDRALLASLRPQRMLQSGDVEKARDVALNLGQKISSMSGNELSNRVEGLGQVVVGISIAVGDFSKIRKSPFKAFFSFGAAINEVIEGGSKLFG